MTPGSQECPHGVETDGYRGVHRGDIWGVRYLAIRSQKRKKNQSKELKTKPWEYTVYGLKEGGLTKYRDKRKEHGNSRLSRTHILVNLGSSLTSINHMSLVCAGLHFCEWSILGKMSYLKIFLPFSFLQCCFASVGSGSTPQTTLNSPLRRHGLWEGGLHGGNFPYAVPF